MDRSPFRERRFAPAEVRQILRRAVDLAEQDSETPAAERPLTQEELERHGGELGLPTTAIRSAVAGEAAPDEAKANLWQLPRRLFFEEEFTGELPASLREDVVDALHAHMGDVGRAQVVGKTLTWTPTPSMQGQQRQLTVTLRTRDGKTRVRIEENLQQLYLGFQLGLGLGLGFGLGSSLAAGVAVALKSVVFGVGFGVLILIASMLLARIMYRVVAERRARQLIQLRKRLREVVREGISAGEVKPARARIELGAGAPEAEAEAEAEAEVESEARGTKRAG